jgi:colanic acid/amylovoran biosynthesis glycosyltransferase
MKLAVLTAAFPYYPGEQFIENEVEYWANSRFKQVFILPGTSHGTPRSIPENLKVDLSLSSMGKFERFGYLLAALFSRLFIKELQYLCRADKVCFYTILQALKHVSITLQLAKKLYIFAKKQGGLDVVYSYWHEAHAYAAILVKQQGLIGKVVARAHGIDLYEHRRLCGYMPLKRQFANYFDHVFALSTEAKTYLCSKYGMDASVISISPLGVLLPNGRAESSPEQHLHIVSVSFCVPVKRIDKIIQALVLFAEKNKPLNIKWTHIGDGPLFQELKLLALQHLADKQNVMVEFKGNLTNTEVKNYYLLEPVDIFINTSESEGIPVSIMEAMSAGIPAIAPDVGGISELISKNCGFLMSSEPSVAEIATSIRQLAIVAKDPCIRSHVRQKIADYFNATINYSVFIDSLLALDIKPNES